MSSALAARRAPMAKRIEQVSGIRPATLLIAFGIVLVIAILMATGIAANDLRRETLERTEREEAAIASLLAAATDRSLNTIDAQLADIADAVANTASNFRDAATAPRIAALLRGRIGRVPGLSAVAVVGPDGAVLAHAGSWPADDVAVQGLAAAHRLDGQSAAIGAPIRDPQSGIATVPLVHRIVGAGAIVGLVAPTELTRLFAATTLPADSTTVLLASDGTVLARYPEPTGSRGRIARKENLGALFRDTMATMSPRRDDAGRVVADRGAASAAALPGRHRRQPRRDAGADRLGLSGIVVRRLCAVGRDDDRHHGLSDRPPVRDPRGAGGDAGRQCHCRPQRREDRGRAGTPCG